MTIFLYFIHDKNKSKPINIFLDNSDLHRYLSQTRTRTYTYSKRKTIKSKWENWAVILNIWIWHHGSFMKDLGLIYWKKIMFFFVIATRWCELPLDFSVSFSKITEMNVWKSLLSSWSFPINSWEGEQTITSRGEQNMLVNWSSIIPTLNKHLP